MAGEQSDAELVQRTLSGDGSAYDALVRRHQARVFHLALQMARDRDTADDWAQEAFVRVFEQLRHFDASRPFVPWLLTVATNTMLNQLRRRQPDALSLDATDDEPLQVPDDAPPAQRALEQRELTERVRAALALLPEKYRVVLTLRHMEEMEYDEIARATGLPLGTVKTFLHRGRERLRALLQAERDT